MSRTETGGVEQAFADWPHTEVLDGEGALHITGKYKAPSWWWQRGFPIVLMLLAVVLAPGSCSVVVDEFYGGSLKNMTAGAFLTTTVGWFGTFLAVAIIAEYFGRRRRLNIKLSREAIVLDGKRYARGVGLEFRLEEHEKGHAEEGSERRTGDQSRIYRDAVQVVLRYQERRVGIADFRRADIRKAEALFLRLQFFNEKLEELLGPVEQADARATPGERDDFGKPPPIR